MKFCQPMKVSELGKAKVSIFTALLLLKAFISTMKMGMR